MRNSLRSKSFGKQTGITVKALIDLFKDIDKLRSLSEFKNWYKKAKSRVTNFCRNNQYDEWLKQFNDIEFSIRKSKLDYAKPKAKMVLYALIEREQFFRIFMYPLVMIFWPHSLFGQKVSINKKILINMTKSLKNYNDLRERWRTNHLRKKLSLEKEWILGNKCVELFSKLWTKYGQYFHKLAALSGEYKDALSFYFPPIQAIKPAKVYSKKLRLGKKRILKYIDGFDIWPNFAKEVTRLCMISKKYEYGERIGTKETKDKMWREIAKDYQRIPRKKRNRKKFYEITKQKYIDPLLQEIKEKHNLSDMEVKIIREEINKGQLSEEHRLLFPKRLPIPGWDRFWPKLYSLIPKKETK